MLDDRYPLQYLGTVSPKAHTEGNYDQEHMARQRRLLFVACTRAMRQLIVFAHASQQSHLGELISDDLWDIETLA